MISSRISTKEKSDRKGREKNSSTSKYKSSHKDQERGEERDRDRDRDLKYREKRSDKADRHKQELRKGKTNICDTTIDRGEEVKESQRLYRTNQPMEKGRDESRNYRNYKSQRNSDEISKDKRPKLCGAGFNPEKRKTPDVTKR